MNNVEHGQYQYLKRQEKLTAVPQVEDKYSDEAKKAWMRKAAAQHKLEMFSDVNVDPDKKTVSAEEMMNATLEGLKEAEIKRQHSNTDKGKAYWKNVERGLKIKKTWLEKSMPKNQFTNEELRQPLIVETEKQTETLLLPKSIPEPIAENKPVLTRFQMLVKGIRQKGDEILQKLRVEPDIVDSDSVLESWRASEISEKKQKKNILKEIAYGTGIVTTIATAALGIYAWLNRKSAVSPVEIAKALNTPIPLETTINTPVPANTITVTPSVIPSATETVTPKPSVTPEKPTNSYEISVDGKTIDLTKSLAIVFSQNLLNAASVKSQIPIFTQPFVINTEADYLKAPNTMGVNEKSINTNHWKEYPWQASVMKSFYNSDFVMSLESGHLNQTVPKTMNSDWQKAFNETFPKASLDKPQAFDMPAQPLVDLANTLPNHIERISVNGKSSDMTVYELPNQQFKIQVDGTPWTIKSMRKVSLDVWNQTCGNTDKGWYCALDQVNIPQPAETTITIPTCMDFKNGEYANRLIVEITPDKSISLDKFAPEVINDPIFNKGVRQAVLINGYQFTGNKSGFVNYLKSSNLFDEWDKLVIDNLITNNTNNFPDGKMTGIQCVGWAGLRTGPESPMYFGGDIKADGTKIKGPGEAVPDSVKKAANQNYLYTETEGNRKWITGNVDLHMVKKGDVIVEWSDDPNFSAGHIIYVENIISDSKGNVMVILSEANNKNNPGQVSYSVISGISLESSLNNKSLALVTNRG